MKPFIYYSSDVVKEFIAGSLNRSMDDLAIQLEAYGMSGIKGAYWLLVMIWHSDLALPFPQGLP